VPNLDNRLPHAGTFTQGSNRAGRHEDPLSSGPNDHSLTAKNGELSTKALDTESGTQHGSVVHLSDHPSTYIGGQPHSPFNQEISPTYSRSSILPSAFTSDCHSAEVPAQRPIFGISLDELLKRDGSAIPLVVYQCIQAIDLFGLDVEGIYRLSGSAAHITKLRIIFDHGK
jgi:hypothetical protein